MPFRQAADESWMKSMNITRAALTASALVFSLHKTSLCLLAAAITAYMTLPYFQNSSHIGPCIIIPTLILDPPSLALGVERCAQHGRQHN
jgi:hypothetical protein